MPISNIGKIKNVIIIVLAFVAVYQTFQLWFEDTLSHNFFYNIAGSSVEGVDESYMSSFVYPYRIIENYGDNRFELSYSNMAESEMRILCDEILGEALKNGSYGNSLTLDWAAALSLRGVIYEYTFSMPSQDFTRVLENKTGALASKINAFNNIIIAPDSSSSQLIRILFIDSKNDNFVELSYNNSSWADSLRQALQRKQSALDSKGMYYISTKLLHMDTEENFYLPKWKDDGYIYNIAKIKTVYYDMDTGIEKSIVRSNISTFFDNPSTVLDTTGDNIASSDENTVVKYLDNDILEYINYKRPVKATTFLEDYAAAIKFIETKDWLMNNDYYLADFYNDGENRYFYFDYVINDFPIVYSQDFMNDNMSPLNHSIEIVFGKGSLIKYSKLAYAFEVDDIQTETAELKFFNYIEDSALDVSLFEGVTFGYAVDTHKRYAGDNSLGLSMEFLMDGGVAHLRSAK